MLKLQETLGRNGIDSVSMELFFESEDGAIYTLRTDGLRAIELWQRLRGLVEQTGYWPVVVGDEVDLKMHRRALEEYQHKSAASIIDASLKIDGHIWLQRSYDTMYDYGGLSAPAKDTDDSTIGELNNKWQRLLPTEPEYDDEETYPRGEWPEDVKPQDNFEVPYKREWLGGEGRMAETPRPLLLVTLVPTTSSWQVPAYMKVGSWNYCPDPEDHCAVFRHWEQLYGAEIVRMTHDTFEMQVERPPQDRESAIELAEMQYGYCPDVVDQGVDTIEALAANLLNGKIWFFWWD